MPLKQFFTLNFRILGKLASHRLWIATKSVNVADHPLHGHALIKQACVATDFIVVGKSQ